MSIDDRSRQELFQRLDEALGPKAAEVLMAHLPPVGWADVATKHDLAALEEHMNMRFDGMEERTNMRFVEVDERFSTLQGFLEERIEKVEERVIGRIHAEVAAQSRTMIFAMMSLILTAVLLTYTAGRFG